MASEDEQIELLSDSQALSIRESPSASLVLHEESVPTFIIARTPQVGVRRRHPNIFTQDFHTMTNWEQFKFFCRYEIHVIKYFSFHVLQLYALNPIVWCLLLHCFSWFSGTSCA